MAFRKTRSTKVHDAGSLYEYAVGALGRRMRTVAELKRLMRLRVSRQPDGDTLVEAVVQKLKEQRYLNDTNYATSYSTLRRENQKFGRMRVVSDLKAKGVHGDVIEKTVGAVYDDVNEEQLARAFLSRKRAKKPQDDKQAARIFRMLARAGFSVRTIIGILKKWDVDDEVLSTMQNESVDTPENADDV
jgi:regulatory protein